MMASVAVESVKSVSQKDQWQAGIGGSQGWVTRWYNLGSGSHIFKWVYSKDGANSGGSDCGWVDKVIWPAASLADALDSPLAFTTDGAATWYVDQAGNIHESEEGQFPESNIYSAASGVLQTPGQQSWLQTEVQGPGTLGFWSKVTSNSLAFSIDGGDPEYYSTEQTMEYHAVTLGSGSHTLRWTYTRQSTPGQAFVDYVQWTGPLPPAQPEPAPEAWKVLTYVYDAAGRRVEKQYDGVTVVKYVYDGDRCIAEYNRYDQLLRKYIYGPGVDEPICMIEATVSPAATYYYHFDALGSVVALTDHNGDTVQVYEYDVYGQAGSSDPEHPNRFLFTGREFDKETGLYYYRARYYNPQIGRFLQADRVGYGAGMNLYRYCLNNPLNWGDPFGLDPCDPCDPCDMCDVPCAEAGCRPSKPAPPKQPFDRLPLGVHAVLSGGDYYGPFDNADEAALAAGAICMAKSAQNYHECGYWVFLNPSTGKYYYTNPIVGGYDPTRRGELGVNIIDPAPARAFVPSGDTIVAWGHSHPPLYGRTRGGGYYDVNHFSGLPGSLNPGTGDVGVSNFYKVPGYLITPSGETWCYDPNTGTVRRVWFPT